MNEDSVVGPDSYDGSFYAGWFFQWYACFANPPSISQLLLKMLLL